MADQAKLDAIRNEWDIDRAAEAAVAMGLSWSEAYETMREVIADEAEHVAREGGIAEVAKKIPGALARRVEEKS